MLATVFGVYMVLNLIASGPRLGDAFEIHYDSLREGNANAFPEFREAMGLTFTNLMFANLGVGDEDGNLLADSDALQEAALEDFREMVRQNSISYCVFDTKNKTNVDTNFSRSVFSSKDGHLIMPDDYELCYYWDGNNGTLEAGDQYDIDEVLTGPYQPIAQNAGSYSLLLAVEDQREYFIDGVLLLPAQEEAMRYQFLFWNIIIGLAGFIVFGLLSLITGRDGKRACEKIAHLTNYVLPEIKAVLFAVNIMIFYSTLTAYINRLANWNHDGYAPMICSMALGGVLLFFLLNDLVVNKTGIFRMSIAAITVRAIRSLRGTGRWEKKFLILSTAPAFIAVGLLVTGGYFLGVYNEIEQLDRQGSIRGYLVYGYQQPTGIILIVAGALVLLLSLWNSNRLRKESGVIAYALRDIRNGQTREELRLPMHAYLEQSAADLNELEKGIEQAVEQKSRADRMQVELITNVSHDLKTPLTSIINYADLLCEENLPEEPKQYAQAIQEKSYQLKKMVQDVFELSKATTGNLEVKKNRLDLIKLIGQTLADIDEKINESTLTFKNVLPEPPVFIEADGDKLYRVFLNLYMNAISYSLPNSRVHTVVTLGKEAVEVRIKNTSQNELDFDKEEIMERFVRADKSRTGEGSGLGLSIAKSFTEACGGSFQIETDADMFIAILYFPLFR